jgi:hypothetical protein
MAIASIAKRSLKEAGGEAQGFVVVGMRQFSLCDETLLSNLPDASHRNGFKRIKRLHRKEPNP